MLLENDLMQDLDAIEKEGGAALLRPNAVLPAITAKRDPVKFKKNSSNKEQNNNDS